MGQVRRTIRTVEVEMREMSADGMYSLWANGRPVLTLTFSRVDGHGRWVCPCGAYQSGKRDPVLAHVVDVHVLGVARSLEARNTSLRLAGKHPDPTYVAAMVRMYGHSW